MLFVYNQCNQNKGLTYFTLSVFMHIPFAGGLPFFFYVSDILLGPIQYLILSEVLFVTFAVRVPGV